MEFNGNHLIELGYRPAKWFKDAISEVYINIEKEYEACKLFEQ